jgi:FKBP-type peptidyl-prolyl cis-trans isomerase
MKKNVLHKLMFTALAGLPFLVFSCMDSEVHDPFEQLNRDITTIDNYLTSNGITNVVKDPNGVRMIITEMGTGLPAELGNTVDVNYTGRLFPDGAQFDAGNAKGTLSGYIDGWKIAFTTLPKGSKAILYIPSYWGYGREAQGSIPANSILQFNVEFRDAITSTTQKQKFQSDTTAISTYLEQKAINATKDTTGIWYVINQQGAGPTPGWYNRVKMKYTFKLLTDDTKVVATVEREPTADFYSRVVDYIHGLKIGLQRMQEGSKATLYIPSGFGFGTTEQKDQSGSVIIPANSNLIIDIELLDIMEP